MEIETKFVNEGFIKTPSEPRKSDTKFREAETEAEACRKEMSRSRSHQKQHLRKPKPRTKSTPFDCLEAEAGMESGIFAKAQLPEAEAQPCWNTAYTRCRRHRYSTADHWEILGAPHQRQALFGVCWSLHWTAARRVRRG